MDVYITLSDEQFEKVKNLDTSLGMWFWNIAVMVAPYDTGNLRRSITLNRNTSKRITIGYNLTKANYLKFLELGVGPVKKHRGFISVKTRLAILEQLIIYLKTAKKPMFTAVPHVTLRSSKSVFSQEKRYLRQANMNIGSITPNARKAISKVRETQYRKSIGSSLRSQRGLSPTTSNMVGQKFRGSTRGISLLNQFYKEARDS